MSTEDKKCVWFHYADYSVLDWDAAKLEAASLIRNGIGFICESTIKSQIENLLDTNWHDAIELYNKHNAVKEFIAYREGGPVYS